MIYVNAKSEVKKKVKIECTVEEFKELIKKEPHGNEALESQKDVNAVCKMLHSILQNTFEKTLNKNF